MNKYVVMTGRDDVVVLNADENKSVKAYIATVSYTHLTLSVAKIISGDN